MSHSLTNEVHLVCGVQCDIAGNDLGLPRSPAYFIPNMLPLHYVGITSGLSDINSPILSHPGDPEPRSLDLLGTRRFIRRMQTGATDTPQIRAG